MPSFRLVLALLVAGAIGVGAQTPNFSGYWTLDRDASDITPPAFSGGRGGASIDRLSSPTPRTTRWSSAPKRTG